MGCLCLTLDELLVFGEGQSVTPCLPHGHPGVPMGGGEESDTQNPLYWNGIWF